MQCHKCGAELQQSDKFCFACGGQAGVDARAAGRPGMQCHRCGAPLSEDDKFCGSCGTSSVLAAQSGPPGPDFRDTRPHRTATTWGYLLMFAGTFLFIAGFVVISLTVSVWPVELVKLTSIQSPK